MSGKGAKWMWQAPGLQALPLPTPLDVRRARAVFKGANVESLNSGKRRGKTFLGSALTAEEVALLNRSSPEIALVGRSNVGKSSLINALLCLSKQNRAVVSKRPGRTKTLNAYAVGHNALAGHRKVPGHALVAVDLPGYGYAKVPVEVAEDMTDIIRDYVVYRSASPNFLRAFLLVDARRGLSVNDLNMMNMFDSNAILYQIVLTKCDAVAHTQLNSVAADIAEEIGKAQHSASLPSILGVSVRTNSGLQAMRNEIMRAIGEMPGAQRLLSLIDKRS